MLLDKEIAAVDVTASKAVDLVQSFAEQDPADPHSCWQNPSRMFDRLDQARAEALQAWKVLEEAQEKGNDKEPVIVRDQDLRAQFMDMITSSFADVLDEMKERENIDLDILVDCLQSGMDIMSQEDKEYFMMMDDAAAEEDVTPHEERRRELGFAHVETTA